MLSACTSADLKWLDDGKMTLTYETPHIHAGVEEAFREAEERMEALCIGVGGDRVDLGNLVLNERSESPRVDLNSLSSFEIIDATKEVAGKTTVTIQGTCIRTSN